MENKIVLKTDYVKALLAMNLTERENKVKNLRWSKNWIEKYYGYNSDKIIKGILGEFVAYGWLNSNKFCKYFNVDYQNLWMVEGKTKVLNLINKSDITCVFDDLIEHRVEIKTSDKTFYYYDGDKPSDFIPELFNKAKKENAEYLILVSPQTWKLIVVDLNSDTFIYNEDVTKIHSRVLKNLLYPSAFSKILGLKGHVVN